MSIVLNGGQGPVINGDTPDVGLANPMSATGDLIVGGASGAATRLAIGSTGYVPRVVGGTVAWRELSAAGLLADRPAAAAGREGQEYWATDAAAGLELSECVHKGGATYAWETVSYGVTATGVALAQAATAADARTALGAWPGAVSADPMTGSGWTATTPASTTATWSGGVLSIVASAGATGTAFVARDAIDTGATSWDLAVRIDVVAGDGMGVPRGLALVGWYVSASDYSLTTLRSDRSVGHFTSAAGSFTNHGEVAGPSSGDLTGGQFWLRHTRGTDGRFVSWWGVGTGGATPTVWTRLFVVDSAALITAVPSTAQAYVGSGAYGEGALTSAWSVDVLAIRPSWQGSL